MNECDLQAKIFAFSDVNQSVTLKWAWTDYKIKAWTQ